MGSRKKKKISSPNKMYQVLCQPFGMEGINRMVLRVFDFSKHEIITFDKKRGKQIWKYPHNESLSLGVPWNASSHPNLVIHMRKIYNQ